MFLIVSSFCLKDNIAKLFTVVCLLFTRRKMFLACFHCSLYRSVIDYTSLSMFTCCLLRFELSCLCIQFTWFELWASVFSQKIHSALCDRYSTLASIFCSEKNNQLMVNLPCILCVKASPERTTAITSHVILPRDIMAQS